MIPVVFINCDEVNFVDLIISGRKILETRHFNTLGGLVDRRVLIAETHKGKKPVIRCSCVLRNPKHIKYLGVWGMYAEGACIPNYEEWWDFKRPGRWSYEIHDVLEENLVWSEGKRHGRVWMEYEDERMWLPVIYFM